MRYIGLIIIAAVFAACGGGKDLSTMTWKKKLKVANSLYDDGSYYNAIDIYKDIHKEVPEDLFVISRIAETYKLSRDYKNAQFWYKTLVSKDEDPPKYDEARFQYALMLKMNGNYGQAKEQFNTVSKKYKGPDKSIKKRAKLEMKACDFAQTAVDNPSPTTVRHMGSEINAAYHDFAPVEMGDSLLLFSSLRSDTLILTSDNSVQVEMTKIYQVRKRGRTLSDRKEVASLPVNSDNFHTGNGSFSPDGKRFYYTRCQEKNYAKINCAIYYTEFEEGIWQEPKKVGGGVNVPGYTSTHPTVAPYKKGNVLYYVSDRPGGQGGMDIWYATVGKKGAIGEPTNLGRRINTTEDEITPYYDIVTQNIYFSSDGHMGLGGLDVFKSAGATKRWAKPENIGAPLNSSVDDMYFVLNKSASGGYMVSNRPGVIALKNETCCDDIFNFRFDNMIYVAVQGYVYDVDDPTKTPLDESLVSLYLSQLGSDTEVEVNDKKNTSEVKTTEVEDVLITGDSTRNGKMYFFNLSSGRDYKVSASKEGYFSGKGLFTDFEALTTRGIAESDTLRVDLYLKKMKLNVAYKLKNIYYDFDRSNLRPESEATIDSLLIILEEHPTIKIEIGSHTDSRGADDYNIKLSQKRAESVVRFLAKKKIPIERMVAKGYGETTPVAPNKNPDGSDNPEGRQLNRRTEFKIIGKLDAEVIYDKSEIDNFEKDDKETPAEESPVEEVPQQPEESEEKKEDDTPDDE